MGNIFREYYSSRYKMVLSWFHWLNIGLLNRFLLSLAIGVFLFAILLKFSDIADAIIAAVGLIVGFIIFLFPGVKNLPEKVWFKHRLLSVVLTVFVVVTCIIIFQLLFPAGQTQPSLSMESQTTDQLREDRDSPQTGSVLSIDRTPLAMPSSLSNEVLIIIADFDGPSPQQYGVTEAIGLNLRRTFSDYENIRIELLGDTLTAAEGSVAARAEGERYNATIVIWGWYGTTADNAIISMNFEVLRPLSFLTSAEMEPGGQVQLFPLTALESFSLQTQLSDEIAYKSLFIVGMIYYSEGNWEKAISSFKDAISELDQGLAASDRSIVYLYLGNAYLRNGDYDQAINSFDQAIVGQPENILTYYIRGKAYAAKGEYDLAIIDYNKVVQFLEEDASLFSDSGLTNIITGEYSQAQEDFGKAIQLRLSISEAIADRGYVYLLKRDLPSAIADYEKAIELDPNYALAYLGRGIAYTQMGQKDKAIVSFNKVIEISDDPHLQHLSREQLKILKKETDK